jgi:hypothetical protein
VQPAFAVFHAEALDVSREMDSTAGCAAGCASFVVEEPPRKMSNEFLDDFDPGVLVAKPKYLRPN